MAPNIPCFSSSPKYKSSKTALSKKPAKALKSNIIIESALLYTQKYTLPRCFYSANSKILFSYLGCTVSKDLPNYTFNNLNAVGYKYKMHDEMTSQECFQSCCQHDTCHVAYFKEKVHVLANILSQFNLLRTFFLVLFYKNTENSTLYSSSYRKMSKIVHNLSLCPELQLPEMTTVSCGVYSTGT